MAHFKPSLALDLLVKGILYTLVLGITELRLCASAIKSDHTGKQNREFFVYVLGC